MMMMMVAVPNARCISRDDGTDNRTVLVGRLAAVTCPIVMLHGKVASENT